MALAPESLVPHVQAQLEEIQAALLEDATRFRDGNIVDVSSYAELREAVDQGTRKDSVRGFVPCADFVVCHSFWVLRCLPYVSKVIVALVPHPSLLNPQ